MAIRADSGILVSSELKSKIKTTKNIAWNKFEDLLLPPLFTFTELRAITVTTLSPPKNPLATVARPSAFMSLFTFERLLCTSNLSTAFMLNNDSTLAMSVSAMTLDQKERVPTIVKSGEGISARIVLMLGIAGIM